MEEAAKALSAEIIDAYPLAKTFKTAAEITERQIARWKDQEIEAAYQAFVNGSEKKYLFFGYDVEKGDFDEVWEQMRGIQTKIYSDAMKDYANSHGIAVKDIDFDTQEKLRKDAKNDLEDAFEERKDQEKDIEAIEKDNLRLLKAFEDAKLFEEDMFGYSEDTSFEFRMERLYKIKDMILKDTGATIDHADSTRKNEISHDTVAKLARLWYSSDDGREKYKEQLIELGYVDGDDEDTQEDEELAGKEGQKASGNKAYLRFDYITDGSGEERVGEDLTFEALPFIELSDIPVVLDEDGNFSFEKSISGGALTQGPNYLFDYPSDVTYSGISISGYWDRESYKAHGKVEPFNVTMISEEGEGASYYSYAEDWSVNTCEIRMHAMEGNQNQYGIQYISSEDSELDPVKNIQVSLYEDKENPDQLIRDESVYEYGMRLVVDVVYTLVVE